MSLGITEQNVGTSMLDRLQGLGELPEARDKLRQLNSTGIRPPPGPEYGALFRQAQLVLQIDAELGRGSDPDIVGICPLANYLSIRASVIFGAAGSSSLTPSKANPLRS